MVKLRNVTGGINGVVLEIDGAEVKELISASITCVPDAAVEVMARTYATAPIDVELERANVTIVRMDAEALDAVEELLMLVMPWPENMPAVERAKDLLYRAGRGGTKVEG